MLVPQQQGQPVESVETLQIFNAQIFANPTTIVLAFSLPSGRMVQCPFERLNFAQFLFEMNKAMERTDLEAIGNDTENGASRSE